MKYLRAILIIIMILCFQLTVQAETFSAQTGLEARNKALDVFDFCALTSEFTDNGEVNYNRNKIVRWNSSIKVYIGGYPSKQDLQMISNLFVNLALRVPHLPDITLTDDLSSSNMQVYFVLENKIKDYIPSYVSDSYGFFHSETKNNIIVNAQIAIAINITNQEMRNHLIQEEFFGALGLTNDQYMYSDSILYGEWSNTQQPSEMDWLMLNMLYSPLISPGMGKNEINRIFTKAWTK